MYYRTPFLMFLSMTILSIAIAASARAEDKPAADEASAKVTYKIRVDTSEVPELEEYGRKIQQVAEHWYPIIVQRLKQDGFTAPRRVTITFKREMKDPAATGGSNIFCSANWFQEHPDDVGAVVHELAHVAQSYPEYDPVWLVEGIADYIRFWMYEPAEKRPKLNPDRISYQSGYQAVGSFLAWLEKQYDRDIVTKLNQACRKTQYKDELFKEYTGKSLDELWEEFKASLRTK